MDEIFSNWHRRLENVIGEEHSMTVQTSDVKIILHSYALEMISSLFIIDTSSHNCDTIKDVHRLKVIVRQIERNHAIAK